MLPKTRRTHLLAFAAAGIVTLTVMMTAQIPQGPVARFTATADNVSNKGEQIRIDILAWSNDSARDQLVSAGSSGTAPAGGGARATGARGAGTRGAPARGGARGAAPPAGAPTAIGAANAEGGVPAAAGAPQGRGARGAPGPRG